MARKRTFSTETLKLDVKNDKVIITFDAQNWSNLYDEFLKTIAIHAEGSGIPVADLMGDAMKLKIRNISPSEESYGRVIRLCENFTADEQKTQNAPNKIDPDVTEPN